MLEDLFIDLIAINRRIVTLFNGEEGRINFYSKIVLLRMLFNVAISNTDDHLRNHGFLLTPAGWVLSPAYDINPNPAGPAGLTLNIDEVDNSLNIDLVMSVAPYFQLRPPQARAIKDEVLGAVTTWRTKAQQLELPANDIERMVLAFQASKQSI